MISKPPAVFLALALACVDVCAAQGDPAADAIGLHYANLAHAMYSDSLIAAEILEDSILELVAGPSEHALLAARLAWIDARRVYSRTEALRFGNPNVDQWEGRVNAWPVDEGFIDYVASDYEYDIGNLHARFDFIASDVAIDRDSVRLRHEHGGIEANVATGFHAIEFLLWGQDSNEPDHAAGERPHTDYLAGVGCTHPPCGRRARYLREIAALLTLDLREMSVDWEAGVGEYRRYFDGLTAAEKLRRILVGLGGMAGGELAGERLRVPLLASAQEDEQSCFSDTTHLDVHYNLLGIRSLYLGIYTRLDGTTLEGPAVADWVRAQTPALHAEIVTLLDAAGEHAAAIAAAAEAGMTFDLQILPHEDDTRRVIGELIDCLEALAAAYDAALAAV